MGYDDNFGKSCEALEGRGGANVMTIGWTQFGVVWGEPVLSALVRPSRHTYALLEKAPYFSARVPRRGELSRELAYCGSRSGREYDKGSDTPHMVCFGKVLRAENFS